MGNTVYNIHAKASLPCVHLPVIAIAGKGDIYWPDDVPEAIRKSCVLWYDPERQGCTNERMAANPVLKDLSGNGHDATCYNFAWSGMSGIGGYAFILKNSYQSENIRNYCTYPSSNSMEVDTTSASEGIVGGWLSLLNDGVGEEVIPEFTAKVTNYAEDSIELSYYRSIDSTGNREQVKKIIPGNTTTNWNIDACVELDEGYTAQIGFYIGNIPIGTHFKIEIQPKYPNALVSDGVDDYAQVAGLPLLTKERGFTVIARRHWISDINSKSQGLVSKATDVSFADGAFCFECVEGSGSAPFNRTFATINPRAGANYIDEFISGDFSYMTSKKYNSVEFKNVGDGIDTDALAIFRLTTTVNKFYSSIALYSLLLFDRDLASGEIDWVKTNILGQANQ